MSLFGAGRLYVVSADRIERDLGAWALWARMGDSGGEMDPLPPVSRVEPGPVHIPRGWSDLARPALRSSW